MLTAEAIQMLVDAGLTAEQILVAARAYDVSIASARVSTCQHSCQHSVSTCQHHVSTDTADTIASRREKNKEYQRLSRLRRQSDSADVSADVSTHVSTVSADVSTDEDGKKKGPPHPLKKNNPLLPKNNPSDCQKGEVLPFPTTTAAAPQTEAAEPQTEAAPPQARPARPKSTGTPIDPDWRPTEAGAAFATSRGMTADTIEAQAVAFLAHHQSKGTLSKSWDASWRTWVINWVSFGSKQAPRRTRTSLRQLDGSMWWRYSDGQMVPYTQAELAAEEAARQARRELEAAERERLIEQERRAMAMTAPDW
jgi:hypothetical protein